MAAQSRVNSFPTMRADEVCGDCGGDPRGDPPLNSDIFSCNDCDIYLCEPCWPRQAAHRQQRSTRHGVRHEMTNISVARKVNNVLTPTSDELELTHLHEEDAETAWFGWYSPTSCCYLADLVGVHRPLDGGVPTFVDYGRFAYLLSSTEDQSSGFQTSQSNRDNRTPSLVSFVGQTGHGKSTVIKLLVDLHATSDQTFPTPMVGAPGVTEPTSEDVHLYLDPITALSEAPILFADCEGLLGGEREPMSMKLRRRANKSATSTSLPSTISERELAWAESTTLRSRQFAVTNLYPRLLYTFSDVIVFVLKNPR